MMRQKIYLVSFFFFMTLTGLYAKSIKVENMIRYNEMVKSLAPGDSLILANGIWKDAQFVFKGKGNRDKYIYLTAETPGKVTIEGTSSLRLSGEWLHVSGLIFRNGRTPGKAVIEFRTSSKEFAYHSILSECVIDKFSQAAKDSADHWVGVYGKKNTIEYCYFGGKSNEGTTLVVWPDDENSINNEHLIYRNYFGPRPRLGSNGGETIRIGTSQVCMNSSRTTVDGNYFERCNGETEIISNKSSDNTFINNTFFESEGSLVLRHGDRGIVAGNWFIGNGKINTGGVRVINEGHLIYNNFFYKLRGDDFRSALAIMNAIPDSPLNGYAQVKNVVIANNTYYECSTPWAFGVGFGDRDRTVKPENTLLLNNLVYSPRETDLIMYYDKTDGVKLDNNLMFNSKGISTGDGTVKGEILSSKVWDLDMVYTTEKAKNLPYLKYDILGQLRDDAVIGAFQNKGEKKNIDMATAQNCGPEWYKTIMKAEQKSAKSQGKLITVKPGTDVLSDALNKAKAGDILVMEPGRHIVTKKMVITKDLTIKAADNSITRPVLVLNADNENSTLFEITNDAKFRVTGIAINGDSKSKYPAKYAFISSREGAFGYALIIDNCEIYDFNVLTGAIYKAYKGSIADSVSVTNSFLRDSYRGFMLSEEKENTGKYNSENIMFENTLFNEFKQYVLDYYRGGNDESTLGGSLSVNHCVFNAIGSDANQTILRLTGIVNVSVMNSIFNNSLAKTSIKLTKPKNSISNSCFSNCAAPQLEGEAKSKDLFYINPRFEKNSFRISGKSPLSGKASDGGNIGLR